jgi:DNA-binding GntR family transcriptional regulator/anti-sigma regulatory factor (Ser/Thr protein kinase)
VLEALKRLEGEGLVEIIPQVGCRVLGTTAGALEELIGLRTALEGLAAEAAARRIGDAELSELENLLHQLEQAGERGDRAAYDELYSRFHLRVFDASGMPHVVHSARSVWSPLRYQLARLAEPSEGPRDAVPEHRELLEALRRRAPKRARAAAERHASLSGARLIGPQRESDDGALVHRALIYAGDEEYLAGAAPFVEEAFERDERVLAVTTEHNMEVLAGALGERAGDIEFRDSREWYHVPSHTLLAYQRYVQHADRKRVRVIGEPVWDDLSSGATAEWIRYESLLNVELALEPLSIMCPYDAGALPDSIVGAARRTHPQLATGSELASSSEFAEIRTLSEDLDAEPFHEPQGPVAEHSFTRELAAARRFAGEQAERAGLAPKRLVDALLAVQEVASNAVVHGGGHGTLRTWTQDGRFVCEVSDEGPGLADPLVPHLTLDPAMRGGPRGLWIARLLCDLVEVRSRRPGLVVRLHLAIE